jgi:hypothetical protein
VPCYPDTNTFPDHFPSTRTSKVATLPLCFFQPSRLTSNIP